MILGIGAFRLSSSGYVSYTIPFDDVAGLSRKAEVKMAGVKVGWVEELVLIEPHHKARATIMINAKYRLYDNAYAIVRQEGIIGTKYLEVIPGDPLLPQLNPGSSLTKTSREAVSMDELLYKFQNIASHVEQITSSLKDAFVGNDRNDQLKMTMENISMAAEKFNSLATSLNSVTSNNEDKMHSLIADFQEFARTLKEDMPSYKESIDRLSSNIESDFSKISNHLSTSANSIEQAAQEATEGFQSMSSIIEKIDEGRGLLGKMVNEDELYHDIKSTVSGIKNYLAKFETLGIVFDFHSESMARPTENYAYPDSKGYFNIRIHTSDSFFYIAQIVASERGFLSRHYVFETYFDDKGRELDYAALDNKTSDIATTNQFEFAPQKLIRERNPIAFGFQFGKIYKDVAFRFGLFEGSFGIGADYYIPFSNDKIAWTMSLEVFDFKGMQRFDMNDRRPHVKWMNRIFFLNNLYVVFGADDFVSQTNANAFWGLGIRFGDDDMKYILSKFGLYVTV
jgi:phospholipid/cholesterol/gamma-HCH transport system substrate-binding protein